MKITAMVDKVNRHMGDELYTIFDMEDAFNRAIDYINDGIDATLPDIEPTLQEYNAIPDRWIRRVLIPFAVAEMLDNDEEPSNIWKYKALEGLTEMRGKCEIADEYKDDESGWFRVEYEERGYPVW